MVLGHGRARAAERPAGRAAQARPARPAGAGLAGFYDRASRDLREILAASAPSTPAWTWSQDHTVGFIRRRQAHEALIHRIDAELAADDRTGMDPRLSADGVDEVLRVMYGYPPTWGIFTPDTQPLRLRATDTADSWLITLGRFTGTDPSDQQAYDEPALLTAPQDQGLPAAATVSGSAADLDCWLWHRSSGAQLERPATRRWWVGSRPRSRPASIEAGPGRARMSRPGRAGRAQTRAVSLRNRQIAPPAKMTSQASALATHEILMLPPSSGACVSSLRPNSGV